MAEIVIKITKAFTDTATNATTTDMTPTQDGYDKLNRCKCANGFCLFYEENGYFSCECKSGFTGMLCEELIIQPSHGKNRNLTSESSVPSTIAIVSIVSLIALVGVYAMWRKYKSVQERQERKQWVKWQESRRQSKATIEGPTIVDIPTYSSTNPPSSALNLSQKSQFSNPSYCVSMTNLEASTVSNNSTKSDNDQTINKQQYLPKVQTV